MKNFFLILLFSKKVLLTPLAIPVHGVVNLALEESISAITPGAGLHLDISEFAAEHYPSSTGIMEAKALLDSLLPEGSVRAVLQGEDGATEILDVMIFSFEEDKTWLILRSRGGVNSDAEFTDVQILSEVRIDNALVYWKNFSL